MIQKGDAGTVRFPRFLVATYYWPLVRCIAVNTVALTLFEHRTLLAIHEDKSLLNIICMSTFEHARRCWLSL